MRKRRSRAAQICGKSDAPKAMIAAVAGVVHKNMKPKEAFELFKTLKGEVRRVAAE